MDPIKLLQSVMGAQGSTADQTNPQLQSSFVKGETMRYHGITSSSEENQVNN